MALTAFQRRVCGVLAEQRRASGESYVAGRAALNVALNAARLSRDIDVFHDTLQAVEASWDRDRRTLQAQGFSLEVIRERAGYVEAVVRDTADAVVLQWVRDSAFRFFPLVEHPDFGLTLHPLDLATNKVLALVGRLEVRDWIDTIAADRALQPLGYLAWAACGKDPGFSPSAILQEATRSGRYTAEEVSTLDFVGEPPDVASLARTWKGMLRGAERIVGALPTEHAGCCVLGDAGTSLCRLNPDVLPEALRRGEVIFHPGRIRGAIPVVR